MGGMREANNFPEVQSKASPFPSMPQRLACIIDCIPWFSSYSSPLIIYMDEREKEREKELQVKHMNKCINQSINYKQKKTPKTTNS